MSQNALLQLPVLAVQCPVHQMPLYPAALRLLHDGRVDAIEYTRHDRRQVRTQLAEIISEQFNIARVEAYTTAMLVHTRL